MNDQELKDLKKGIVLTAAYYGRELKPEVVSMMADDLNDLQFDLVSKAYAEYRRDPKNRTMPLPAHIRAIVQPVSTPEIEGREAAAKITQAIVKYGYSNGADARAFLGERVWSVVESFGGWNFICTSHGVTIDPSTFYAQVRERVTDVVRKPLSERHLSLAAPLDQESLNQSKIEQEKARQIREILNLKGGSL